MVREVKLSRVSTVLGDLEYPISRADVVDAVGDVRVLFADGDATLGSVLERCASESYADATELQSDVYTHLPVEAVGEPGQAEGEG
ncbi:MAG: hypothetical protein ABEJ70_03810 [Halobacteriaceae archaeon]